VSAILNDEDVSALREHGVCVSESLLSAALLHALAADCRALASAGALQPAAVGRGGGRIANTRLRGDATRWIEDDPVAPVRGDFLAAMEALRIALNRRLLLGLDYLEAHYALYPPGAGYVRHRDRFRDDDARVLSFTAYLNADWPDEAGGALRLHLPAGAIDVPPRLGTCTLFLSAEIEHEVLPATRPRLSIAGWFRRR
jgi:SM-20-related protein